MPLSSFLLTSLAAIVPLPPQTPGPTIEQLSLGPAAQDASYSVSPRGGHVAVVARKGSRFNVLVDGTAGAKFDEIMSTSPYADPREPNSGAARSVVFSKDGAHWAYIGRSGQELALIADGKELFRVTVATPNAAGPRIAFSGEDGKHLFVTLSVSIAGQEVWIDGKKMPGTFSSSGGGLTGRDGILFSHDGARYAYIASRDSKSFVIVDGADAGYSAEQLEFTADGEHLFAIAQQGAFTNVFVDGKPKMKTDGVASLVMAPTGNGFAAVLQRLKPPGQFLVVNGKRVEGSDCTSISRVVISPDGKRWAAICSNAPGSCFVLLDGKKGQEYNFLSQPDKLGFSADSTKAAYVAVSQNKQYVVVNDDESDAFDSNAQFVFSADGKHVAYSGFLRGPPPACPVFVDGKAEKLGPTMSFDTFAFDADGARHGYTTNGVVIDGKPTGLVGPFGFSPDGKHWICQGLRGADNKWGVFVDGKVVGDLSQNYGVHWWAFTADGQHLFWMSPVRPKDSSGPGDLVTFLDGQPVAKCDFGSIVFAMLDPAATIPSNTPRSQSPIWQLGADGALTVIGPVGDSVQRFHIVPKDDTSLDKLLAGAK